MKHEKYNGWTNYETWAVKLWIDNDEGSQDYRIERARETDTTIALADELKFDHEEYAPEVSGVYADLLGASLSSVDWYEIAEALIEDSAELSA